MKQIDQSPDRGLPGAVRTGGPPPQRRGGQRQRQQRRADHHAYIEDELARERLPSGHPGESVIGVCEGQRPGEGV